MCVSTQKSLHFNIDVYQCKNARLNSMMQHHESDVTENRIYS